MTTKPINSEEYDDPDLYDIENDSYKDDIPFLKMWASKQGGTILDIACGTGRSAIPLAEKGFKLIGIDIHKGMLKQAKLKTKNNSMQVKWVEQDCTNFDLNLKSRLAYMTGNSFQHFLTNESQNLLFNSIYNHLEEDGVFIFNTRFPSSEELLQPSKEEYWKSYVNRNGQKVDVYTISSYDSLNQVQDYITIRKTKNETGIILTEKKTKISLRYVYPKEMVRLLSETGFEIIDILADWDGTPVTNESYQMIYVCKKISSNVF